MKPSHRFAIGLALVGALVLLAGMITNYPLDFLGGRPTRQVCIAVWTYAVPVWFNLETFWRPDDELGQKAFDKAQTYAKQAWLAGATIAAIVFGFNIPTK